MRLGEGSLVAQDTEALLPLLLPVLAVGVSLLLDALLRDDRQPLACLLLQALGFLFRLCLFFVLLHGDLGDVSLRLGLLRGRGLFRGTWQNDD